MCAEKTKASKFAFDEDVDHKNHFTLTIVRDRVIFQEVASNSSSVKAELSTSSWKMIAGAVSTELRKNYGLTQKSATFTRGLNKMTLMAGREIMPLLLAVEEAERSSMLNLIERICNNWTAMEEHARWWLYTLANTKANDIDVNNGLGWRKAIFVGLAASYE